MSRYRITTPDGKRTFEVDGPDDATPEELQQFARMQAGVSSNYPVEQRAAAQEDPEKALFRDIGGAVGEIGLGALQGGANVLDHAADWTQSGLNAVGQLVGGGK